MEPYFFFFSSRRRHTRWPRDWSSDVCSSDLGRPGGTGCPSSPGCIRRTGTRRMPRGTPTSRSRSEEHTSELQSRGHLVCRLLLEKKKMHRSELCESNRNNRYSTNNGTTGPDD